MGHERIQANSAAAHFGKRADGDLTAAAEFVEQSALAGGGGAGGCVIEKSEERPRCRVAPANFDSQSALSSSGRHHLGEDHLAD